MPLKIEGQTAWSKVFVTNGYLWYEWLWISRLYLFSELFFV